MLIMTLFTCLAAALCAVGLFCLHKEQKENRKLLKQREEVRSEIQEAEKDLYFSPLTKCQNIRAFYKDLAVYDSPAVFAAFSSQGSESSLKYVNDSFGYAAGDAYIREFSRVIRRAFPEEEGFVIYYEGASNFFLLARGSFTEDTILEHFEKLKQLWHDTPYTVPDTDVVIAHRMLEFAATHIPEGTEDRRRLRSLVFEKVLGKGMTFPDGCGYFVRMSDGKSKTNVTSGEVEE